MDIAKLKEAILEALKPYDRLWDEGNETLNQTLLLDLVESIDEGVISLLFSNNVLREKFFVTINGATIFKSKDFRFFMEENKIDNSYTQYRNRIGLSDGERFLKDSRDVVLNFPYKDCVLEGGQTKEDTARKEIFFNEVLAQDEIDRLLDKKVFVNWKRHDASGAQAVDEIKRGDSGTIRENMIIKGNNLLVLHSLKKQFTGKVKLIYIDPPYNTEDDSFRYNDKFTHSTWLTFMKNRLEIAKQLLRDDGSIFVQCSDIEQAYLKVLMDEIFGRENFKSCIAVKTSTPSGVNAVNVQRGERLFKLKEYLVFYSKLSTYRFNPILVKANFNTNFRYKVIKNDGVYTVEDMKNTLGRNGNLEEYALDKDNFGNMYSLEKNNKSAGDLVKEKIEKSKLIDEVIEFKNTKNETVLAWQGGVLTPLKGRIIEGTGEYHYGTLISDFWDDEIFQTNKSEGGVQLEKGKKPEKLIKRIIEISTKEDDIVLDFFVGSGTTAAVAHKMGRQYIGIEQLDYIEELTVPRLKKVIEGEQSGISKSVEWDSGGDFLYFELAKWNEQAKEEIEACKDLNTLIKLFDKLCSKYFLHYNFKIKDFKKNKIKEEEFKSLSLSEQKKMFHAMLDLNQMYVCSSEMADKRFSISEEDQKLTKEFYDD